MAIKSAWPEVLPCGRGVPRRRALPLRWPRLAYAEDVREDAAASGFDLARDHANVCVLRTSSKAYGLAGLRVGYAVTAPTVATGTTQVRRAVRNIGRSAAARRSLLSVCSQQQRDRRAGDDGGSEQAEGAVHNEREVSANGEQIALREVEELQDAETRWTLTAPTASTEPSITPLTTS